jgi:hypothetical protein
MSRATHEENVYVYFATAVANIEAPTLAEITAATDLTPYITKDGVVLGFTENRVDNAGIASAFDAQNIGSHGAQPALTMFRDTEDETDTWDLLQRGDEGFLIRSFNGPAITGSQVEVYPVEVGIRQPANSAANENQKFTTNFAVTADYTLDAVVAAS